MKIRLQHDLRLKSRARASGGFVQANYPEGKPCFSCDNDEYLEITAKASKNLHMVRISQVKLALIKLKSRN